MPFAVSASSTACNQVLQKLKTNAVEACPFTFWTDVTTVASYFQPVPASIKQRMGGIAGSVLDQFGGEYEYDVYAVKLHRHRGTNRNITYRYGKNITDLTQEENIANTVTGVVPYWTDMDNTMVATLPEKAIYSSHASEYSHRLTVPLDLSQEWEDPPTADAMRAAATVYVNKSGFGVPKVSTEVSFVNLADTEEYENALPLQNVNLCDTITIQFERLGISTTAEIVETVYDVLKEKYIKVQIGELRSNLAATLNDIEAAGAQAVDDMGRRVYAEANTEAQGLIDNATAWLTSADGYVIARKDTDGSWKELIFADHDDPAQWHNVLRINQNGIGFSSNGGGSYTQAWTLDGRLVIGGTNVPSITVYDSNDNIIFQASATAMIWNATNSSMSADGTITAKNAELTGGELNLGGANNGVIYMRDSRNRLRGEWSRSGFYIYDTGGNIVFEVEGGTASMKGSLHTGDIDLEDNTIVFDNDSRIEGNGFGNGININSDTVVFSVDSVQVTEQRGGTSVRTGWTGQVLCDDGYIRDVINGIICQ
jgi:phage minor structural protein